MNKQPGRLTTEQRLALHDAIMRVADSTYFDREAAEVIAALAPITGREWPYRISTTIKSNKEHKGCADGIGDIELKDERERQWTLGSSEPERAGTFRLCRPVNKHYIRIWKFMETVVDEPASQLVILTDTDGRVVQGQWLVPHTFSIPLGFTTIKFVRFRPRLIPEAPDS